MATKKIDTEAMNRAALALLQQQQDKRPVHVHQCPEAHAWTCPSPYCENVSSRLRRCLGHGGELPRDTDSDDFTVTGGE